MTDTVLVTGATGFIAQHCILQLLQAGYRVRATARSVDRAGEVVDVLAPHLSPPGGGVWRDRFELLAADLTADDGWAAAVEGCRFVLHVASPVPHAAPRHEDEVIVPARDGVRRVLRAARAAGVRRVVLTSSTAAIIYGHDRDRVFTEADWSNLDDPRLGAYERAKTLAERAAWEETTGSAGVGTELAVINPGLVLGPLLGANWSISGEMIRKVVVGEVPAIPDLNFAPVDVRDVASAHITAMTEPRAANQRFVCAIESHSLRDVARILAAHLDPLGFRVPTRNAPDGLVRLAARWDRTMRLGLNDLGVPQPVDATRAREVLGWSPRGLPEMVTAMADSMVRYGVVAPPRTRRRAGARDGRRPTASPGTTRPG